MTESRKTVAFFPGQGAQHVGMAKDLVENFKLAKEIFEEASDAVRFDLTKLCFDGPESELTLTENTQPALLTASVAAYRVAAKELGFAPTAVAGHSLGEYSALVAAESISLSTAVRWVRERGLAMQQAVPAGQGTMAALLGMDDDKVRALCLKATDSALTQRKTGKPEEITVDCIVEPANFNAPGQVVIAGSVDAVQEAAALVKAGGEFAGGKVIPLQVSAPFHCRLMTAARDRMAELFKQSKSEDLPRMLACPYVPNRTARIIQEPGLVLELLIEQIDHPVLWRQSVVALAEANFTHAVEFGPGKVLTGLAKRITQPIGKSFTMLNVGDSAQIKALETLLKGAS